MPEPSHVSKRTFHYTPAIRINYEVQGEGTSPVVFIHGFAAALTTWDDIRRLFPPKHFSLYLLDLKGFGFSSKPLDGRYSLQDQAALVLAFLEQLGLSSVTLVGHSLGGGIALLACLAPFSPGTKNPVHRLVLLDCAAYPQKLPWIMGLLRNRLLARSILHLLPLRFIVRFSLESVMHDRSAITRDRITRYLSSFRGEGIDNVFTETCRELAAPGYAGIPPLYRTINVPTLIVWGNEDRLIPPSFGERLHADIPGSRLVVIKDCGHIPQEERPMETYSAILEFLTEATAKQR